MNAPSQSEKTIDELVQRGEISAAVALILERVAAHAGSGDFTQAEALRDRLYEVDPMALQEILKAGEIIEAEKSRGLEAGKLTPFGTLMATLTPQETNALYYSLQERQCQPAEIVFKQGDLLQRLYFVQNGQLRLHCRQTSGEAEIATLQPGDIVAAETFFSATLSTMSLAALTAATLLFLEKSVLERWQTDTPTLKSKLQQFCQKQRKALTLLGTGRLDRRLSARFALGGSIFFQILGSDGQATGKALRGELADIAAGGLSFLIKTAIPRNADLLLGRQLGLRFTLTAGREKGRTIQTSGRVVGVQHQMFNDYSVHLRLNRPLEDACLSGLATLAAAATASRP